jgi:phage tail tape-measure protein
MPALVTATGCSATAFSANGRTARRQKAMKAGARVDNRGRSPERAAVWRTKPIRIIRIAS